MFPYEWSRSHFAFAQDIVHFTKQGKLEYYEGNFDAFRCPGFTCPAPSFGCNDPTSAGRKKTQLDAEGAKDVG